ncbi:hypothetical protein Tco_0819612 [Tanacetum coccineum]|uniref:Retrovirus-related Pol polyprotein from transposon TNT 1-94 n=1 Tax=Tanacetum coccineum TaxID=301880 RepID=A0ABQ5ABA7_9ASTR
MFSMLNLFIKKLIFAYFFPEYSVILISVHKLSRDSKLFVESNCYIQDLKGNETVGIGKQYNDLYLIDMDNAFLNVLKTTLNLDSHSTTDHLYETCKKAKQTRELFPLRDHKSSKIGKVKYGVEKVVGSANVNHESFCFASGLNKSVEPTCYEEDILDNNWIDAMNAKIEALNKNDTWDITDLLANRKAIGNK